MLFALYFLQGYLGLEPCPLCMVDRVLVIGAGASFLLALLHNPAAIGRRLYAGAGALFNLSGIGVCLRHIWLQNLPKDAIPTCAPGLDYMLETLPMTETLRIIFTTSGECAEVAWTFLGLSIPEQTLIVFVGLLALNWVELTRKAESN
jgi:disulfide bond formation protein DsbB